MNEIVILGMGKSGQAVQKACKRKKIPVTCFDDMEGGSEHIEKRIREKRGALFVVVSPGVPPSHKLVRLAKECSSEIGTEIDVAFKLYKKPLPPILGVTGTNGKTTVVEFTAYAASAYGMKAETVGNIGVPLVERLFLDPQPLPELFVMELSSFQLEYSKKCPLAAAAYLNFAPDHLDWHEDVSSYHAAKGCIASHIMPKGSLFLHPSVPDIANLPSCLSVYSFSTSMTTDLATDGQNVFLKEEKIGSLPSKLKNNLLHDTENFLASFGLLSTQKVPYSHVARCWDTFEKGPHRIQLVHSDFSLSFWDDSKATNISSTEAAVKSLQGPIVLIAGGVHKGFSYASWKEVFRGKVISVVAIGAARESIYQDLTPDIPVLFAATLKEAVSMASQLAPKGGNVLLSPGCSSFDMFKNYKDRGDQFQALVKGIRSYV